MSNFVSVFALHVINALAFYLSNHTRQNTSYKKQQVDAMDGRLISGTGVNTISGVMPYSDHIMYL